MEGDTPWSLVVTDALRPTLLMKMPVWPRGGDVKELQDADNDDGAQRQHELPCAPDQFALIDAWLQASD